MGSEAKIELYHQTSPGTKNETLKAEGTGTHPMPAPLVEPALSSREGCALPEAETQP